MRSYFFVGRLTLLPVWLLGTAIVWLWSRELYGNRAAVASVCLWCTFPESIAWQATICPDASAASLFVCAMWCLRRWLKQRTFTHAVIAGLLTGLAICTKFSLLVLLPVAGVLVVWEAANQRSVSWRQCTSFILAAWWIVNSAYVFEGSMTALGEFEFASASLIGSESTDLQQIPTSSTVMHRTSGNRFRNTVFSNIPVPVPRSMIEGIDLQKRDFERPTWCYLRGEHRLGGWWYWYLYALFIKTPAGTLLLIPVTAVVVAFRWIKRGKSSRQAANGMTSGEGRFLLLPALSLLVLVSSQTAMTQFPRYVLPVLPFLCIWLGQTVAPFHTSKAVVRRTSWLLLLWSAVSSLSSLPSIASFSTELIGPRTEARKHLAWSAIDWGQDYYRLCSWIDSHPDARPILLVTRNSHRSHLIADQTPHLQDDVHCRTVASLEHDDAANVPRSGWYAIGISQLVNPKRHFEFLEEFEPVETIGHSILIYRLSNFDIDGWRDRHGSESMHP